jgi:DNA polymerase-1
MQLEKFSRCKALSIDTETTGLNPYKGARPFVVTVSDGIDSAYLELKVKEEFDELYDFMQAPRTWYGHNVKFDLHQLESLGLCCHPQSKFYDSMVLARLVHSDLPGGYSLANCGNYFLGEEKLDTVKAYIEEHGLWDWVDIPGIDRRDKAMYFDQVPREIMEPYARQDAVLTFRLTKHLLGVLEDRDRRHASRGCNNVLENESRLITTIQRMERFGVRIDTDYVKEALEYEQSRIEEAKVRYEKETGEAYVASAKAFTKAFGNVGIEVEGFDRTDKGSVKFDSKSLSKIEHPAAICALEIKDAKSRTQFFSGFLWNQAEGLLHTSFNQNGTKTGRLSSSQPNLQNMTRVDEEDGEIEKYPVRRAVVPYSSDYCLVMIDYDQQEFRVMLDYAGEMDLIESIKGGLDVHQATADRTNTTRTQAKTLNFAIIYGAGKAKISEMLGLSEDEGSQLIENYFAKLPMIKKFLATVKGAAKQRGFLFNWTGRMLSYPDRTKCYAGPNHLIQGSCGDIIRIAMNRCDNLLIGKKSRLSLSIHDELVFNIHREELHLVPEIKFIMESTYPYKHLPLTTTVSHSWRSLADKTKGFPKI